MYRSKYGIILTILIILAIIAILIIGSIVGVKLYVKKKNDKEAARGIADFDTAVQNDLENKNGVDFNTLNLNIVEASPTEGGTSGASSGIKVYYYKDYVMLGHIEIPKTNVQYPILADVSVGALEVAVGVVYPSNPKLNTEGNIVIIGHNYRNGQFFSNNKKLEVGDKIKIKDSTGTTLTYTIYEKFETTSSDASFYNRDTNGAIEITLSTCTDSGDGRLILKAKV